MGNEQFDYDAYKPRIAVVGCGGQGRLPLLQRLS